MNKITMTSKVIEVTEIKKKTKAKMFKNLKVGSRVVLSIEAKTAGQNRGTYSSYIQIRNIDTNEVTCSSFNEIETRLNCFGLKELL